MDLDGFQKEIGGISKYQVIIIFALGLVTLGQGFTSQAAIFISAVPDYRCAVPPIDDTNGCNLTETEIKNLTIPYDPAQQEYSKCQRYGYNLTGCDENCSFPCITNEDTVNRIYCDNGYRYDDTYYGETTTSQWDLVCDRRYLDTIAQTLFFLGFFIGSAIVGPLSDWFGRKTAVLVLVSGLITSSIGCAFVPTYELFVFVRVLVGTFNVSTFIAVFTYASEIADTKWRTEAGAWINMGTAIAHTVYPGIAYLLRDWRSIQLTIALLPSTFLIMYFVVPETPRWLLTNGKLEEARKVVSRYAKSKGKTLTDDQWRIIVETENKKRNYNENVETGSKKIKVWDLFRRPLMRLMCFNVMFSWFTVSMVFYGLALNGGNLAGDPYLNNALNAVVEIAAYICIYFADLLGRRPVLITSFLMSGIACISSMLCDLYSGGSGALITASTVLAIMGKFFASNGFALIYTVSSEIFPTDARATGVSLGSMAARVGSMLSPLILELQTTIPWFTQTFFGVLSIISGLLAFLYPETSETDFISSLDAAEDYYRENIAFLKWFKKGNKSLEKKDSFSLAIDHSNQSDSVRKDKANEKAAECKSETDFIQKTAL